MREIRLGNIYGEDKGTGYAGNVWSKEHISPALTTMQGGGREPMIIESKEIGTTHWPHGWLGENADFSGTSPTTNAKIHQQHTLLIEKEIVAMRGREEGQQLEPRPDCCTNTITTVQKDNLVMESKYVEVKQATKQGSIPCEVGGGGRSELSEQHNSKGKGARERTDKPNTNNGEYP